MQFCWLPQPVLFYHVIMEERECLRQLEEKKRRAEIIASTSLGGKRPPNILYIVSHSHECHERGRGHLGHTRVILIEQITGLYPTLYFSCTIYVYMYICHHF